MRPLLLALTAIVGWSPPLVAQSDSVAASSARQAATLLQGIDTTPFIDPARVETIVRLLATVRARFPELADIPVGPDLTQLEVHVADSVVPRLRRPLSDSTELTDFVEIARTRVAGIDSLNATFGAKKVVVFYIGENPFGYHIQFRGWPNVPVLADAYRKLPQVAYANFPIYAGDGSYIRLSAKNDLDHLIFARGGGDCPAGCTEWDYYYVTHHRRTGRLTKEDQILHSDRVVGNPHRVFLWDFPTRHSFMPYPTADSLLASTKGKDWWQRQHALDVLFYLLSSNTGPWHGAGEQDPQRFRELQAALRSRWKVAARSLVDALADPDPDLRKLVRRGLKNLYGNDFGEGITAQRHWRTWLEQQPESWRAPGAY